MPPRRRSLAALLLCGLVASSARAQGPPLAAVGGWESVSVPGGVAALLETAGLDPARPRSSAFRDLIRILHASPEGTDEALDAERARVLGYLTTLAAFDRAVAAFGPSVPSLAAAANGPVRKRIEDLASAMGCVLDRSGGRTSLKPATGDRSARRRQHLQSAGLDPSTVAADLNAGRPVSLAVPSDDVPLPLPASAWPAFMRSRRELAGSLSASILADRSAALIYYGMTAMDDGTRAFLAAHPSILDRLKKPGRAGVFAVYGRSIRVKDGRVVVPGGTEAESLWEALAGEPVQDAERFIGTLVDRDAGRLALLYDTAQMLDAPRRQFLLGMWDPDAASRLERFKRLYAALKLTSAGWDPRIRPFYANRYDLAHVLAMTPMRDDGRLRGLDSAGWWRRVFATSEVPSDASAALAGLGSEGPVDAATIVEVLARLDYSAPLAETWWFGHRLFDAASPEQLPDVFVVLRGFERYRVLMATLERMNVTDPPVLAAAVAQAERLTSLGGSARAVTALSLFQGAISLIEHARLGRVIDPVRTTALVRSLGALQMTADGDYRGSVGLWLNREFLPAARAGLQTSGDSGEASLDEDVVLRTIAGRALGPADSANLHLDIEGLSFVVDVAGAEYLRLREIRRRQGGVPIDGPLRIIEAASALRDAGVTPARLSAVASDLERVTRGAQDPTQSASAPWSDDPDLAALIARAVGELRKVRGPRDGAALASIVDDLLRTGDDLLGRALVTLAYAPHLSDPDGLLLLAGGPSARHDWGIGAPPLDWPVPNPWLVPREDRADGGWFLRGSILGLDIALGDQALRRVVADRVPQAPTIKDSDRVVATDGVVLGNAFECGDAARDAMVAALGRGRARVASLLEHPESWSAVAERAGIADVRRPLLEWTLGHEPERAAQYLSLADVLRLAEEPASAAPCLDAWGASSRLLDGRWALVFPARQPFELLAGRRGSALVASLLPDLALSMAEALARRGLPAVLTRHVMAAAAQDYIDEVRLAYEDDWFGMLAIVPTIAGRIDDYVAALTVDGPLRPGAKR